MLSPFLFYYLCPTAKKYSLTKLSSLGHMLTNLIAFLIAQAQRFFQCVAYDDHLQNLFQAIL